jgi:hypothetical protein
MQALTHVDSPFRETVWSIDTFGAEMVPVAYRHPGRCAVVPQLVRRKHVQVVDRLFFE